MADSLHYDPVRFTGEQALAIARGIAAEVEHSKCIIHACAILPDHLHFVLGRHDYDFDNLIVRLKASATRMLQSHSLHPFEDQPYQNGKLPSPWGRKWWKVYLDSHEDMVRAIKYVENNPIKDGLKAQQWSCVTAYEI